MGVEAISKEKSFMNSLLLTPMYARVSRVWRALILTDLVPLEGKDFSLKWQKRVHVICALRCCHIGRK